MLRRLSSLYTRYVAARLTLLGPTCPIRDANRDEIGYIDRIELASGRLRVAGWVQASNVTLLLAGSKSAMSPRLRRDDVAQARGLPADTGFDLNVPCMPETLDSSAAPGLVFDAVQGGADIPTQSITLKWSWTRRALMQLAFLRDLTRVIPSIIGWFASHDPIYRARVKDGLGLNTIMAAEVLESDLLTDTDPVPPPPTDQRITIVLPVYNAFDLLPDVLARITDHTDIPWRLIMIEDRSTDDRVLPFLRTWTASHSDTHDITLIENPENRGFIRSVNEGLSRAMAQAQANDGPVVLLNSDALVPAGWASRLIQPLLDDTSVATATPMSNDAEIFSAPTICAKTDLIPGQVDAIDAAAQRLHPDRLHLDVPTGVGFCMAMARGWLDRFPALDTAFGRGYGEEVDWCQKVRNRGGRHVGVPNLFVEHRGGESFGAEAKQALVARNNDIVSKRYPTYDGEVQNYIGADPLATARLALGLAWAGSLNPADGIPVYLAHTMGGGAEHWLESQVDTTVDGGTPVVILRVGGPRRWQIELHAPGGVTQGTTDDSELMHRMLGLLARRHVIYSCGVGALHGAALPTELRALAKTADDRIDILFHDFYPLSPSYTLLDTDGVYRGPPERARDDKAHQTRDADGRTVPLADWQDAWKTLADRASTLRVFSRDSARHVQATWPDLADKIVVTPHALPYTPPVLPQPPADAPPVLAVLGNIGFQKGAAVLQDLAARLGPAADGTARLVLIGNIDPAYALPAHVKVHGSYHPSDIADLVRHYGVTHWLIPSIWPETFSYTTHETIATGLPVLAFDIGAQGEAVRKAHNGVIIPLDPTPRVDTPTRGILRGSAGIAARNVIEALDRLGSQANAAALRDTDMPYAQPVPQKGRA